MTTALRTTRLGRLATSAAAAGLALVLGACDPCAGVAHCGGGTPYLAATGRIVDRVSGAGVDGVRVDVVRTGGITVREDSLSATTANGGFWRVEFSTTERGALVADVAVTPAGVPAYRVRGLALHARPNGGDANLNETWVTRPYFNYAGELFLRGTVDQRIENRPVEFRLRGGVRTIGTGVRDSIFRATTDVGGRIELFPKSEEGGLLPLGAEELIGDLTVFLEAPLGADVIRGIRLSPSYVYFDAGRIARYAVGP